MSVEMNRDPAQSTETERRAAVGERVPFEGIVEVGAALGPSFEAQAVDLSEDGIHLRTAYLPDLGQPLTCRLEVGSDVVLASGEVVWRQEADRGGEFGMRFTDLDAASEVALRKLISIEPTFTTAAPGTRVRLHIEGLGSPMRAHVKGSEATGLVVESELGFLQVGKELELENARTGGKRPARVARVGVEINPETQIPQLVVSLRYDAADTDKPGKTATAGAPDDTPEPIVIEDDKPRASAQKAAPAKAEEPAKAKQAPSPKVEEDMLGPMRSGVSDVFYRASEKVAPAISRFGAQAKTAVALVVARARKATSKTDDVAAPPRRTTAPPPAGGLHASGHKVVRADKQSAMQALEEPRSSIGRRRAAIGSAVVVAGVLALVAAHKPAATAQTTAPATTDPAASATSATAAAAAAPSALVASAAPVPLPASSAAPASSPTINLPLSDDTPPTQSEQAGDEPRPHKKAIHVTPFGNGAVGHANVLHLRMDGAIEKIEGAATPTGFNVVIPDRRSLEAAAPLAARDSRIAAIRVTNESSGAELAVSFKDGVPNYQVRAKGDSLEILLAPQGKLADADDPPRTSKHKHLKHAPQ
jgi:hypothetical protein